MIRRFKTSLTLSRSMITSSTISLRFLFPNVTSINIKRRSILMLIHMLRISQGHFWTTKNKTSVARTTTRVKKTALRPIRLQVQPQSMALTCLVVIWRWRLQRNNQEWRRPKLFPVLQSTSYNPKMNNSNKKKTRPNHQSHSHKNYKEWKRCKSVRNLLQTKLRKWKKPM